MTITAAVTAARGAPFELADVERDELRPDELLVEIAAAGICHTDLIVRDQWYPTPLPAVLGHEGAGVVRRVGAAVTAVAPGDRVALSFNSCGRCPCCMTARPAYCHDFFGRNFGATRPDGSSALSHRGAPLHAHFFGQSSFATHAVASERSVVKLDAAIPLDVVAPFGCGIQTGAAAVLVALQAPAGSRLAVFGTGGVGLAAVMAAVIAGCTTIIGVDVNPDRLRVARELGATHTVDPRERDPVAAVLGITGAGADFSLETTAVPAVLRQAVDCLAPVGVCGVIGAAAIGTEAALDMNTILTGGRVVRGIVEGDSVPQLFLPRLIELWQAGRFPAERIMTHYDFDAIDQAARDAAAGRVIKPVLRMGAAA